MTVSHQLLCILMITILTTLACGPNWESTQVTSGSLPEGILLTQLETAHTIKNGKFEVTGFIHNVGNKPLKPVQITAECYNSEGVKMASPITGTLNDILPGDSCQFDILWHFEDKPTKVVMVVESIL